MSACHHIGFRYNLKPGILSYNPDRDSIESKKIEDTKVLLYLEINLQPLVQ